MWVKGLLVFLNLVNEKIVEVEGCVCLLCDVLVVGKGIVWVKDNLMLVVFEVCVL